MCENRYGSLCVGGCECQCGDDDGQWKMMNDDEDDDDDDGC